MKRIILPDGHLYKIKTDRYQKDRGNPKMLDIHCSACGHFGYIYQKDGPGSLIRSYLDRIAYPPCYQQLSKNQLNLKDLNNLTCPNCQQVLAVPIIYDKEKRLAYQMITGAFTKKTHLAATTPDL